MGKILSSYIMPHPPIIIPEIGKGEELKAKATYESCVKIGKEIASQKPTTIIITSPHGIIFSDAIAINVEPLMKGSFKSFGQSSLSYEFKNNKKLVESIGEKAKAENIFCLALDNDVAKAIGMSAEVDHGALVPLYFVNKVYKDYKLIHIAISDLPLEEQYLFGALVGEAIRESDENVVIIGSGDLSHRLSDSGPYEYNQNGPLFDKQLMEAIEANTIEALLSIDKNIRECAGECGYRSFVMISGMMDGYEKSSKTMSYEGPFGVGYGTAKFDIFGYNKDNSMIKTIFKKRDEKITAMHKNEDDFVSLARRTIETYVKHGEIIDIDKDESPFLEGINITEEMLNNCAGVFVSVKKYGNLRGCIGTTAPTCSCIAKAIVQNAISACSKDPRFDPVDETELKGLTYSVDQLMEPEDIRSTNELDPMVYGVIVSCGTRRGLLLPNLEGIDTIEKQMDVVLKKAGIRQNEDYSLQRFKVIRHH